MSLPQRFSDNEYRNWVKCGTSLTILQKGLHEYINTGVKNLHADIKRNVVNFLGGPGALIVCQICSSKGIQRTRSTTRNPPRWTINCASNICNVWLDEILAFHNEPQSKSINWRNADITKWATDPFEIAKIFMPKGQDKKKNLPEELDAPAILSVLKYCIAFSSNIPNLQLITDLIEIRNTLFHSGDLRVCDSDRDTWIDMMLQLVADLNIQGTIYSELYQIKTEDIDIDFRQTELRALQNMVSSFHSALENVHAKMEVLESVQSKLSIETQATNCDSIEIKEKTNALESDVRKIKEEIGELTKNSDKLAFFVGNNPDIDSKHLTCSVRKIELDVNQMRCKQLEIETNIGNIKEVISSIMEQMDRNLEETNSNVKRVESNTEEKLEVMEDKMQHNFQINWIIGENFMDQRINYNSSKSCTMLWTSMTFLMCAAAALNGIVTWLIRDNRLVPLSATITGDFTIFDRTRTLAIIMVICGISGAITQIYDWCPRHRNKVNKITCILLLRVTLLISFAVVCGNAFTLSSKIPATVASNHLETKIKNIYEDNFSNNDSFVAALDFAQHEYNCCWMRKNFVFQSLNERNQTLSSFHSVCLTSHLDKMSENQTRAELIHSISFSNASLSETQMGCFQDVMFSVTKPQESIFLLALLSAIMLFLLLCSSLSLMKTENNMQFLRRQLNWLEPLRNIP